MKKVTVKDSVITRFVSERFYSLQIPLYCTLACMIHVCITLIAKPDLRNAHAQGYAANAYISLSHNTVPYI